MTKSLQASVIGIMAGFASLSAYALPVHVDAGSYGGSWRVDGTAKTGSANLDLAEGAHSIMISSSDGFKFTVAANGTVTPENMESANGGVGSLAFKTATVNMNPQAYAGSYMFDGAYTTWFTGAKNVDLVTGIDYRVKVGAYDAATFHLNADGTVTSLSPASIDGFASTVTLRNSTLEIDPADFIGGYVISGASQSLTGPVSVALVPNLTYAIIVSGAGTGFKLDAAGNVASVAKPAAAFASGNKLTFKTVPIVVDPGTFKGVYFFQGAIATKFTGVQTVKLLPHGNYMFGVGYGNNPYISIDANGNVFPMNRPDVMSTQGNVITLKNIDINMTATGASFTLDPSIAGALTIANGATQRVTFVPNQNYRVWVTAINGVKANPAIYSLQVMDPCAITPGTLTFSATAGSGTLSFTCPSLVVDTDADTIPDETDNCPTAANTDQLDMDNDRQGDACDADVDGDTVGNTFDNCPVNANSDQRDLDMDTLGDACDSDIDGDGVQDAVDNCPLIANAGQGNSDGDTQGDACDVDDDNDSVDDQFDNCPVTSNADQSDMDGDREGDMCDGDRDGDSVGNDADQCPATPAGSIVTIDGCNGAQLIAKSCKASDFKNHGQYVSCVTKAANEAVILGLISNKEKSAFVTEAAQSK